MYFGCGDLWTCPGGFFSQGLTVKQRKGEFAGRAAIGIALIALIYAGGYLALRSHFTGNLCNEEGYIVVPQARTPSPGGLYSNRIEIPDFGPRVPDFPLKLNNALDVIFYPMRRADMGITKKEMIFTIEFPITPPHPHFFPVRPS